VVVDHADNLALYNGLTTSYPCTACQTTISLSNPTWIRSRLLVKWQTEQDTRMTWINADGFARQNVPDASAIKNVDVLPGYRYVAYKVAIP
jgi:hypothetical protein